jgi:Protein of unknown function (DUF1566)
MKRVSVTAAAPAVARLVCVCVGITAASAAQGPDSAPPGANATTSAATPQSAHASDALPDIGTRMPDGRVYAGLSMDTGKPSFVEAAGGKMPDGTVYAGISPDTGRRMFTTPADAPGVYTWGEAMAYCKTLSVSGHDDWRVPSIGELAVQFTNRADVGGFNETGRMKNASGYYWSSLQIDEEEAWGQLFSDGFHENFSKSQPSSLRCVR